MDVYLHPEAASVDDILLQAAIQKKIGDSLPGRSGLVHVRAVDRIVFLSGSVASEDDLKKAIASATNIDLKVDGKAIQPAGEIHCRAAAGDALTPVPHPPRVRGPYYQT